MGIKVSGLKFFFYYMGKRRTLPSGVHPRSSPLPPGWEGSYIGGGPSHSMPHGHECPGGGRSYPREDWDSKILKLGGRLSATGMVALSTDRTIGFALMEVMRASRAGREPGIRDADDDLVDPFDHGGNPSSDGSKEVVDLAHGGIRFKGDHQLGPYDPFRGETSVISSQPLYHGCCSPPLMKRREQMVHQGEGHRI